MVHPVRPPLAKGRVRHAGEPVAVGSRPTATRRPTPLRWSRCVQPAPAVITPAAALADGAEDPRGARLERRVVLAHKTDGVDEAFANAEVVVKHTIRNQRLIHVPIETRGVVAD
jgi:CO/xanthine dehydrogenase Mo-binding subunit